MVLGKNSALATIVCAMTLVLIADASAADEAKADAPQAATSLKERSYLFGDWGGARSQLAQHGVIVDLQSTQFLQSVVSGADDDDAQFGLKGDLNVTFLGEKLGLWKGLFANIHVEGRAGDDVNGNTGLSPGNVSMLMPSFDDGISITQLTVTQALSEEVMVFGGKVNSLDFVDSAFHTGRGVDKFMNTSMVLPIGLGLTVPLAYLGTGIMKLSGKEIQGGLVVYDPNDSSTTSGFPAFEDVAVIGIWKFFHDSEYGNMPGYISLGGTFSSKQYAQIGTGGFADPPQSSPASDDHRRRGGHHL